ncbi:MAG: methyltransferase domain-containing protein [Oscillospiraceae bacterium]
MLNFCCPNCKQPLTGQGNSLVCEKNHCFDKAKSGYVNLLLPNKMNSKTPGDNKIMVDTRNEFLSKGYYSVLKDELCKQVLEIATSLHKDMIQLLDAGCGEGYYTTAMAEYLENNHLHASILGVDISKLALNIAAKRTKSVQFGVASVFDIPVEEGSCDIVTELFAPYCGEEFYRVLKRGGILILVIPSQEHLYELKQAVYENPYKNDVKDYNLEGFELQSKTEVFSEIEIDNQEDIKNLFMMTPYYYKTSKEDTARLMKLERLHTKIQFEILCYRVLK